VAAGEVAVAGVAAAPADLIVFVTFIPAATDADDDDELNRTRTAVG
jgi:hypothetical protein